MAPVLEPDPVVPEVPGIPVEPVELVDGEVPDPVEPALPSVFLPQPPNASAAASASATAPADLSVGAYISVSFKKLLERLNVSQIAIYL